MKKHLTAVFLIFAFLLTMAGCSATQKLDAAGEQAEAKLEIAEEKLEDSLRKGVSPTQTVVPTETQSTAAESPRELTKEQAQKIALDYLGLHADQVTRLRTEYEMDNGIPQFDIEFYQGDWEYEFEIHAETGKIISYDKDHKYD